MGMAVASPDLATESPPNGGRRRGLSPVLSKPEGSPAEDSLSVDAVAALMAVDPAELNDARRLLGLLGDPGRRTIIEHLSLKPDTPGRNLPDLMGMDSPNIYHRLRSLRYNSVVYCDKYRVYHVDPKPLRFASRYFHVLSVAMSLKALS